MPYAPARACACGRVGCTVHRRPAWGQSRPRVRGRRLQRSRLEGYVAANGACAQCQRVVPFEAAIRDHVVPLAEGGVDDDTNTQLLCLACHALKTQAESARGVQRARN